MSLKSRAGQIISSAVLAGALATAVVAATPVAELRELDEVLVTARKDLPLPDFVKFPKYESVAISPSGTRLAMAWIDDDYRLQLALHEFPSMKSIHNHALSSQFSASDVSWASEERLLLQPRWPVRGLLRVREELGVIMTTDPDGGKPHIINREAMGTGDPLDLLRREEAEVAAAASIYDPTRARLSSRSSMGPVRVVTTRTGQPDQVLIQTRRANDRGGNAETSGVYVLDLKNNQQTQVATLPLNGGQVVTGPGQQVAIVTGINARNESVLYYLPPQSRAGGKDWQLIPTGGTGTRGLRPIAWTGNGEEYYALDGRSTATRAVVIWNAADNTQRQLYRHAAADMEAFALDPSGRPWMFSGNDLFPVYWYPDPEHPLARLHRAVVQKVPGEHIDVTTVSDDMKSAVIHVSSGRRPPVYLAVNVESASSLASLFSYPTLRGTRLARVEPIEFRARDGVVIHGYLTTPEDANGNARIGLPMVVMAHAGPMDEPATLAYEFERQLFASRGYAVLQVNHRGSSGRGVAFERGGDGKWGREVQDDHVDGVRWAVRDGVADAERICFYGIGYGAFTALTAAARAPELFNCVIGVGGVYDLPHLLGDGKEEIAPALRQILGSDMEELKARSPVNHAAAIKARVLLMPQERDEYIPIEQSRRMRNALREADNSPQWEMIGQEYNGQHTPESRAGVYVRILRFLEQRIGN